MFEKTTDANAKIRLQQELDYIEKNETYAEVFAVASELVSYSRELGYYSRFFGCLGSSLIAFLLGITEIDPLKYNLPVEVFMGVHNDKPLDIELKFDMRFIPMAKRYMRENYPHIAIISREDIPCTVAILTVEPLRYCCLGFREGATNRNTDKFDQKNVIKLSFGGQPHTTALNVLSELTGVDIYSISFDDKQTIEVMKTADIDYGDEKLNLERCKIRQLVNPGTFEDLIQMSGWIHGTYQCAPKDISNMPAFRDDVFLYLLNSGIDRVTAYEIMDCVRKGKGLTEEYTSVLSNAGISKQYIDNLKQVKYLFSKAHCIALTMAEYRMAWFEAHYAEEFQKVMKRKKEKLF
ncbi:MAG: hypothetical protein HFI90_01705 [Clostridia bacterium]|nr:hypothetical protein [Clostridia bacterium]